MNDKELLLTLEVFMEVFDNLCADLGRSPDGFPARKEMQEKYEILWRRVHDG